MAGFAATSQIMPGFEGSTKLQTRSLQWNCNPKARQDNYHLLGPPDHAKFIYEHIFRVCFVRIFLRESNPVTNGAEADASTTFPTAI